jgi:hypothetical protein
LNLRREAAARMPPLDDLGTRDPLTLFAAEALGLLPPPPTPILFISGYGPERVLTARHGDVAELLSIVPWVGSRRSRRTPGARLIPRDDVDAVEHAARALGWETRRVKKTRKRA